MQLIVQPTPLEKIKADLLVVNTFAGDTKPNGGTGAVDKKLHGAISKKIKSINFLGKNAGDYFLLDNHQSTGPKQIMVISLGERKNFSLDVIRKVAALSLLEGKKQNAKIITTILHGAGNGGQNAQQCAQSLTEGILLSNYHFDKYLNEQKKINRINKIKKIIISQRNKKNLTAIKQGIKLGTIFAEGQNFARDLVNEPGLTMDPKVLADTAKNIAAKNKNISVKIFTQTDIAKLGMNAFLAVAAGSEKNPYFIHLTYQPQTKPQRKIVVVGKSITFDSGGLSLKPADSMTTMKCDMAGGAAVLGLFSVLSKLQPNVEIHGLLAACENMPSGSAIRVGDVVQAMNGKTIEILNTDAEGRLTLADALTYAEKLKPDFIIDLATLTGAAIVALGENIAALMTDNKELENKLIKAGESTGEKIWPLPLEKNYLSHIKSNVADIQNVGKGKGVAGTIAAGLFLQQFVKKTPWAHLDIAGPAWTEDKSIPYLTVGGSGWGVRLLLDYIKNL